jgi:hypothetical protein
MASQWQKNHMDNPASWIIKKLETNEVILEIFDKSLVDKINTEKYVAIPILQHLYDINSAIKKQKREI